MSGSAGPRALFCQVRESLSISSKSISQDIIVSRGSAAGHKQKRCNLGSGPRYMIRVTLLQVARV